jgi:hypothetical protein
MEWLRASENFPACWACFLIYDDRVEVLAITGSRQRIDHSMSPAEARALWADLCECGWHHASEQEVTQQQIASQIALISHPLLPPCFPGPAAVTPLLAGSS